MPWRRRSRLRLRRSRNTRSSFTRRRFTRRKTVYRKAKRNLSPLTIIDRDIFDLTTDSNGKCYFAINLNGAPGKNNSDGMVVRGNPGTPVTSYNFAFKKFASLALLWEQVRCKWIKVQFIPRQQYESNFAYVPMYIIRERDGMDFDPTTFFGTTSDVLYEPRCKAYNFSKPFKLFQRTVPYGYLSKVPPYPEVEVDSNTGFNIMGQWHGMNSSLGNLNSANSNHIYGMIPDGPPTKTIGDFVCTAKFECKGALKPPFA